MKREIKFRAWDNQNKCWYKPIHEAYKGNLFELMVGFSGDLSAHTMGGLIHESLWPDRFELVQFTGLKDKNGKEIYEFDICTFTNPYSKKDYKRVVRYCPLFACFGLYPDMETVYDYESDWVKIQNIEIIGNVYENPELLKS